MTVKLVLENILVGKALESVKKIIENGGMKE